MPKARCNLRLIASNGVLIEGYDLDSKNRKRAKSVSFPTQIVKTAERASDATALTVRIVERLLRAVREDDLIAAHALARELSVEAGYANTLVNSVCLSLNTSKKEKSSFNHQGI